MPHPSSRLWVVAAQDDTSPIELATGRPKPFRRREVTREITPNPDETPNPDVPRKRADRTPSGLFKTAVESVVDVSRSYKPTDKQVDRMHRELQALFKLVELGFKAREKAKPAAAGGGGSGGAGPTHWVITAMLAVGSGFLGAKTESSGNGALAEAIAGRMDAQDDRLENTERRLGTLEDSVEGLRYSSGKIIEWQGQELYKSCVRDQEVARALNYMAKHMPKSPKGDDDKYDPIYVHCEQNPILPEDLTDLRTHARRIDNARK